MASDADQSEAEEARVIREMEFEDKIARLEQQLAQAQEALETERAEHQRVWEDWTTKFLGESASARNMALREHRQYMEAREENAAMRALLEYWVAYGDDNRDWEPTEVDHNKKIAEARAFLAQHKEQSDG